MDFKIERYGAEIPQGFPKDSLLGDSLGIP